MAEITQLLLQARAGDEAARDRLFARVYAELEKIARGRLARESTITQLDAPSLVNEAYLRLQKLDDLPGEDRRAFFAYSASVMRSVIVDFARARSRDKRGGEWARVTLTGSGVEAEAQDEGLDVEALDLALQQLLKFDPRCHQVVELRYFGGLSVEEVAELTGTSAATVKRDWQVARAFLFQQLGH